jgi:hypothetical protein
MKKKIIISDYGWLETPIEKSWIKKLSIDYLILDKKGGLPDHLKIKKQKNVGQNIYDIFDYIYQNYDQLEDILIFCRACIMFPKNRPWPYSNGNCSEDKFFNLIENENLTEIHDYETHYHDGYSSYIGKDNEFNEINTSWYLKKHKARYFYSFNHFMNFMFSNYSNLKYIRFSPGGAYVIPKKNILFYSRNFYKNIRRFLSWDIVIGDAHILERSLYYIFSNKYHERKKYSEYKIFFNQILSFLIYHIIYKSYDLIKNALGSQR